MSGIQGLVATLLYGTGMRLMEGLRLRVKDVEFERREIVVRDGKGGKDRVTVLPENLVVPLQEQLESASGPASGRLGRRLWQRLAARRAGGEVSGCSQAWGWQWVFAAASRSTDPRSGEIFRHHLHEQSVQRAVYAAAKRRGSTSPARRMFCGTRLRPTCCKRATTSARCRNCLATRMSRRR